MTLTRTFCCCSTCQQPTGSTSFSSLRHIVADRPVPGLFTGSWTSEWKCEWSLQFSGSSLVTALSSVRIKCADAQTLLAGGSAYSQYNRVIDITLVPRAGSMDCNTGGSVVCGSCGTPATRLDPVITLPHTTSTGLTLNSYTNTASGAASAPSNLGVAIFSGSDQAVRPATPAYTPYGERYWCWDGSSWLVAPDSQAEARVRPLRAYTPVGGTTFPEAVCPPIDQIGLVLAGNGAPLVASAYGAGFYDTRPDFGNPKVITNVCPGGKRELELLGWDFTTDTTSVSIT